jgi:hypothetical protein
VDKVDNKVDKVDKVDEVDKVEHGYLINFHKQQANRIKHH